ncbi:hypothetical protein [Clostridium oryzae]|nr:hypothetical protein [Clostridium oryzae]
MKRNSVKFETLQSFFVCSLVNLTKRFTEKEAKIIVKEQNILKSEDVM